MPPQGANFSFVCLTQWQKSIRSLLGNHGRVKRDFKFQGIVNTDKSQSLSALLKYEATNTDIVDCILAAASTESRPVISFDSDIEKLKGVTESL